MRILVTRPAADAESQARELAALGHEAVIAPLSEVVFAGNVTLPLDGAQALIVTSRNALRALKGSGQLKQARALPLFAVGRSTAALALDLGFAKVRRGSGRAEQLVPLIASNCRPEAGSLVHVAGETLAFDLKGALERQGFRVRQAVVYRTVPAERLPDEAVEVLKSGALDGVILMSPAAAKTYAGVIRAQALEQAAARLVHYCLSRNVAAGLQGLEGAQVRVAAAPTQDDLLALIGRDAANC